MLRRLRAGLFSTLLAACSAAAPPPPVQEPEPSAPMVEAVVEAPVEGEPAEPALEEDATPDGAACEATSECEDGQHCRGPVGCEAPWACGAPRECGTLSVAYCGCDALTFYALEGCPGQPYQHVGPCDELGEEIAANDVEEVEGNTLCATDADCRAGYVCGGVAGCGTFWTCVRRRAARCGRERVPYCSCDGETFAAPVRCPGRPIAHAGDCAGDEPEQAVAAADPTPTPTEPPPPATTPAAPAATTPAATPARAASPPAAAPVATAPPASPPSPPEPPAPASPPSPPEPPAATPPGPAQSEPEPAQPSARPCISNRECPRGQVCEGAAGCDTEWFCARPSQRCIADTQYFCGCGGETFLASMTCPGRPHRHRGSCPRD